MSHFSGALRKEYNSKGIIVQVCVLTVYLDLHRSQDVSFPATGTAKMLVDSFSSAIPGSSNDVPNHLTKYWQFQLLGLIRYSIQHTSVQGYILLRCDVVAY